MARSIPARQVTKHPTPKFRLAISSESAVVSPRKTSLQPSERAYFRDQLGVLAARCQWVSDDQQRTFLNAQFEQLWNAMGGEA